MPERRHIITITKPWVTYDNSPDILGRYGYKNSIRFYIWYFLVSDIGRKQWHFRTWTRNLSVMSEQTINTFVHTKILPVMPRQTTAPFTHTHTHARTHARTHFLSYIGTNTDLYFRTHKLSLSLSLCYFETNHRHLWIPGYPLGFTGASHRHFRTPT